MNEGQSIQSYAFTVKRFGEKWFEVARRSNGQAAGKSMVSLEVGESITVSFPAGLGAGGLALSAQPRMVALTEVIERLEQGFGKGCAPVTTLLHHFSEAENCATSTEAKTQN